MKLEDWLSYNNVAWRYQNMKVEQKEELQSILAVRMKWFVRFCPAIILVCAYAFALSYKKSVHFASEKGLASSLMPLYICIWGAFTLILIYVFYRTSIYFIQKDIRNARVIQIEHQAVGKKHFPNAGKYFLFFATSAPFDQIELTEEEYSNVHPPCNYLVDVAPKSKHIFGKVGKYYKV